ncbi:short-chain dehydrogenase [Roseibium aquae]|uniref:Short-chain dehydrogenase n=1 Tax=Roseibium aquae TaxID=1323746 RepID=A0A916TME8_9HYPH|nr:SDR family NAD(P)-dependent oxidoreductase [Roseibium aquae]GGB57020.1 short-chain dehydrogenase [Roseibium aquae]
MQKAVLITGAGTGIGKDTAKRLVARGHKVYASTHHESEVDSLQAELGTGATVFKLDVTNAEDRLQIANLNLDVLVNNAAQSESGSLAEIDINRVRRLFEVNVFSSLELSQIAIKSMIGRGGGTVIFISSIVGRVPAPFLMPYSMTKFALSAAAAGLREEMKKLGKGIHVSVVEPGPFKTGFNQKMSDSRFEWMEKGSLFSKDQIEQMKNETNKTLNWLEANSTDSIVSKIVAATEAREPKLRYVAPLQFALLVRLLRILGK